MTTQVQQATALPRALFEHACSLRERCAWEQIASLTDKLPPDLDRTWLPAADEVAFALGQLGRHREAIDLLLRACAVEGAWRRASALAYQHYAWAMALQRPGKGRIEGDRETIRKGFRRWIEEALRLRPDSIKDLYRLGVFEAQVESRHDAAALRALMKAIEHYVGLPDGERERRGDLRKVYLKALYAAARSALRLGRVKLARKLSFACIREDKETDHVAPVHKLHLAARVCLASGELDHAERAARVALDGKGPARRDYLFGLLSDIALKRNDASAAVAWIDTHVPPHRRDASLWRRLGDAHREAGDAQRAAAAWDNALKKDRCGRHLTLVRLGELYLEQGQLGRAEDAFRKAVDFCKSRYMRDDPRALAGLGRALQARGKAAEADRIRARLAKARPRDDQLEDPIEPDTEVA